MVKKVLLILVLLGGLSALAYGGYEIYRFTNTAIEIAGPVGNKKPDKVAQSAAEEKFGTKKKVFNILLLGIDRRHKTETGYRSDVMILVTVNQEKKKILMTSVPRDLWVNGGRVNALYVGQGWEGMKAAFERISGQTIDAYIRCDFMDLVWLVDAMGGVKISLDRAFTDTEFPNDVTNTYMTINYAAGDQTINGTQALQLSRSRHGNNGEGSDFMRMKRQHKILKAMPDAAISPTNMFNPFTIEKFYQMVTDQGIYTDMSMEDAKVLWNYFANRNQYMIDDLYVDSEFLYNPPLSEYGGAWVLIPKNNDYTALHMKIEEMVGLREPAPVVDTSQQEPVNPNPKPTQ